MKKHYVIIGGGISGITTALILGKSGRKVTLVEKAPHLSMTVRGFTRKGIYFDTGLHLTGGLAPDGLLTLLLRYLGIHDFATVPFNPQSYLRILFSESQRTVDIPVGMEQTICQLAKKFPGEEEVITAYIRDIDRVCQTSNFLNISKAHHLAIPKELSAISLAEYFAARTDNKELTATLAIHCLLHGVSPKNVSFAHHAYIAGSYHNAVHTFAGGGQALINACEEQLAQLGVTVICGDGAKKVESTSAGTITAVILDSDVRIPADSIVYAAHPSGLLPLFSENTFKSSFRYRIANLEDTLSAHIVFGVSATPISNIVNRSLIVLPDTTMKGAFAPNHPPEQGPFYITSNPQPTAISATSAGQAQAVSLITPGSIEQYAAWSGSSAHKRPSDYYAEKNKTVERVLTTLHAHTSLLANIQVLDSATPLTLRDYMHTPTGSLYGCSHSRWQFPPGPATRLPGLWVTGQAVVAPGILGAMISSFLTCGYMTDFSSLLQDLRACK